MIQYTLLATALLGYSGMPCGTATFHINNLRRDKKWQHLRYSCGGRIFAPLLTLSLGYFHCQCGITCTIPIKTSGYGPVSIYFCAVCYYCLQSDPDYFLDDTSIIELTCTCKQQFAIVHLLCRECCKVGKGAKMRAPNNVISHPKQGKID